MSYCRFQNTYSALVDCFNALYELDDDSIKDLSLEETNAALRLIELCANMVDEFMDQHKERQLRRHAETLVNGKG